MKDHADKLRLLDWLRAHLTRELDEAQLFPEQRAELNRFIGLSGEIRETVIREHAHFRPREIEEERQRASIRRRHGFWKQRRAMA